jgi:hypothetical protein
MLASPARVGHFSAYPEVMTEEKFIALCDGQPHVKRFARELAWRTASKPFALWQKKGDQPGAHLRSAGDPRFAASTYVKMKQHNFVHVTGVSDEEMAKLVAASHALAIRKDGGVKRGDAFADLYIVVRKALRAVPAASHPPHIHAGGPLAKILGNEGPTGWSLAVWAAELIPSDEDDYKRLMKLARDEKSPKYQTLWSVAYDKYKTPSLRAARSAVLARGSMAGGYVTRASSYAAEALVEALGTITDGARIKKLIAEADDRTLVAEFVAAAKERGGREDQKCQRVLWRGPDDKGNCGLWLVRVAAGKYALLSKQGKRWSWSEGTRDDVLSTVPDKFFADATRIAIARDI